MRFFNRVYRIVKRIPFGKVAAYGQIAALAGTPRAARQVGWALHQLDGTSLMEDIPWHRVVNREGRISTSCIDHPAAEQASLLKKEGIAVEYRDGNWYVELDEYLWKPRKLT